MKKILSILIIPLFAGNLSVDGGLSVTGNINANNQPIKNVGIPTDMDDAINAQVLQDALRDNNFYEYMYCLVKFNYATSSDGTAVFELEYKNEDTMSWNFGWTSYLNSLNLEGWIVNQSFNHKNDINGQAYTDVYIIYELKRIIEE